MAELIIDIVFNGAAWVCEKPGRIVFAALFGGLAGLVAVMFFVG